MILLSTARLLNKCREYSLNSTVFSQPQRCNFIGMFLGLLVVSFFFGKYAEFTNLAVNDPSFRTLLSANSRHGRLD